MDFIMLITVMISGIMLLLIIGFIISMNKYYHKAESNQALIRTGGLGSPKRNLDTGLYESHIIKVSFGRIWAYPIIHKLEILNLDVINFSIERIHENGLICKDYIRADIKANFFITINATTQDIKHVVTSIGAGKALKQETLENLFTAKFSEAMKTAAVQFDFEDLIKHRDEFKKQILMEIGADLNGYSLDSMAIDHLEQTKIEYLDENNILDAKGIEKIKKSLKQQPKENN